MTISNYITILRLLLIPVIVVFITADPPNFTLALLIFIFAAITDAVDGYIARKTKTITEIGKFLDPMADKLLLTSSFIALTVLKILPIWLTVIVVLRDIIIFVGWTGIYALSGESTIRPTFISKVTTFFQMMTVIFVLILAHLGSSSDIVISGNLKIFIIITGILTGISGTHYIVRSVTRFHND